MDPDSQQACGLYIYKYKNIRKQSYAMGKTTRRITGSSKLSPLWKPPVVCAMTPWTSTCGYQSVSLQEAKILEALQYDMEIPCIVQWGTLWFSAPTSLNNALLTDGVMLEKYNEAVNLALQDAFTLPYWRMNTPRSCFLRSIRAALEITPERVWNLEKDMMGWRLGEIRDLLFDIGDSDNDLDSEDERGLERFLKWVMPCVSSWDMRVSFSSSPIAHALEIQDRRYKEP